MQEITRWDIDEKTRVRWVYDENYETIGFYAYDTEEETKEAENWEIERLESGELVPLGFIIEEKCSQCGNWDQVDSLWGIVIEPDEEKLREFFNEAR